MANALNQQFSEGLSAAIQCEGLSRNPYLWSSASWNAWRAGYAFRSVLLDRNRGVKAEHVHKVTHGRSTLVNVLCRSTEGRRQGQARFVFNVDESPLGASLQAVLS